MYVFISPAHADEGVGRHVDQVTVARPGPLFDGEDLCRALALRDVDLGGQAAAVGSHAASVPIWPVQQRADAKGQVLSWCAMVVCKIWRTSIQQLHPEHIVSTMCHSVRRVFTPERPVLTANQASFFASPTSMVAITRECQPLCVR